MWLATFSIIIADFFFTYNERVVINENTLSIWEKKINLLLSLCSKKERELHHRIKPMVELPFQFAKR